MIDHKTRRLIKKIGYILLWLYLLFVDTYFLVETFWR